MNRCMKLERRVEAVPFIDAQEELEIRNLIAYGSLDPIVMMDNEGRISFWNPAAETEWQGEFLC